MKYFEIPKPVVFNGQFITFAEYLDARGSKERGGFSVWDHPAWRASAESFDAWESAREAVRQAGKYCAMSDEAFAIFRPLATREGDGVAPELMPFIKPIVRATSTKPEDFDATSTMPSELRPS